VEVRVDVARSLGRCHNPRLPEDEAARTLAFLFTDIEGSTSLWERAPEAMRLSLRRHDAILREAIEGAAGEVVKTTGDGVMAVFKSACDGVRACQRAQLALGSEPWNEAGPLRVRMGLHAGEAAASGGDYHGPAVNRAARIATVDLAEARQVLA
jgi:class 3 adenylate cyclase